MTIYRGIGGSGDSATGEDVFGDNSSITSLNGISGAIQTPTYIKFASGANHTANQGELTWNTAEGTLDLGLNHGGVVLQIGQELHYRVTNQSGSNIPDGTLVAFVGTTGNSGKLLIDVYDGTQASKAILGLTTETIVNGTNGYVTSFGKVRGIQTNGANYGETWVDGDILYPSPTGLTKVLPQAPAAKQPVAVVVNAHNSNGELFVRVQSGTTLGEDELIQLASLTDGDVLQYDGVQARFENRSLSAAGILPTSAIGTTVQAYDSNLTSFVSTFTLPTTDSTNGYVLTTNGTGTLSLTAPGGVADGDKGDITVSTGGTVWTIDNDAVTYAKIQNVSATDKLLGRSSVGAGDIEEITCTQAGRNLLDDLDTAAQRTTLGLVIGTNVQAYSANLDEYAAVNPTAVGLALLDDATTADQRTTLGLGTIATQDSSNVSISGGTVSGITSLSVSGSVSMPATTTEARSLELGFGRSGNGNSFIDLIGDATYTDYGLRIIRKNVGANSDSELTHRGTGGLILNAPDAGNISVSTNGASRLNIDSTGALNIISGVAFGYSLGSGGTVTQATSRTTGVTLNKPSGAITMFTAAGSTTAATFTVTNSTVAATDVVVLSVKSATNLYDMFVSAVAAGSFNITFRTTGGTSSDAPVINFAVIKGATS